LEPFGLWLTRSGLVGVGTASPVSSSVVSWSFGKYFASYWLSARISAYAISSNCIDAY
jgi:hypothetical protein